MLLYCLRVVVLCCLIIETFKTVGVVCGVVACKDNGKVGGCGDAVLLTVMVVRLLWECEVLVGLEDRERGWKKRERTPTRALPR